MPGRKKSTRTTSTATKAAAAAAKARAKAQEEEAKSAEQKAWEEKLAQVNAEVEALQKKNKELAATSNSSFWGEGKVNKETDRMAPLIKEDMRQFQWRTCKFILNTEQEMKLAGKCYDSLVRKGDIPDKGKQAWVQRYAFLCTHF